VITVRKPFNRLEPFQCCSDIISSTCCRRQLQKIHSNKTKILNTNTHSHITEFKIMCLIVCVFGKGLYEPWEWRLQNLLEWLVESIDDKEFW
jgi:hypothetical protein